MAPIKFEDNIREKLEGREIQPSSDAWKKLSERLDENSEKSSSYFIWYAVAASLIGVLIAVSVFSNSGDSIKGNSTDFVEVNTTEVEIPSKYVPNVVENISEEKNNEIVTIEQSNSIKSNEKVNSGKEKLLQKKNRAVLKNKVPQVSEAIAINLNHNQAGELSQIQEEIVRNDSLLINKRIDELMAQGEELEENHSTVSVEEINTLLTNAARKIETDKVLSSRKIDPSSLLGDVELEMENTFREKVFKAIGDGYDFVKTAVVDRNN